MKTDYYSGTRLVLNYINRVFPEVDRQLDRWISICTGAGDHELADQALSSISLKKFHAQGGSVYALYPEVDLQNTVNFIVALQTISDYLDNLCDRAGVQDEISFRQLHYSMLDAVDPDSPKKDYYLYYPYKYDNNYLESLVEECRKRIALLPSYPMVADKLKKYVRLYSELQTYKHLTLDIRESRLHSWAIQYRKKYPDIYWWEFSAAAGSTLGIFILFAAACNPKLSLPEVAAIDAAYFPWICGLHILLDYYIDAQEDMMMGDLNFTNYYTHLKQCETRLSYFVDQSLKACSTLPYAHFHITIVKGLLSMYLSDPKASVGLNRITSFNLIKSGGEKTNFYYTLCRFLRIIGKL